MAEATAVSVVRQGALDGLGLVTRPGAAADSAGVSLSERRPGSITLLRGDAGAPLEGALSSVAGLALPRTARSSALGEQGSVLWLGPDEWLLALDEPVGPASPLRAAAVCVDQGDAYVVIRVRGADATQVLAKSISVDLHPSAFPVGSVVRTAFTRITAIVHHAAGETFDVYVMRSFARYAWCWLADASEEYGLQIES